MSALRRFAIHPLVYGSVALMAARLVSIVAGLATVSIVVRALDGTAFGFWSALVSLTTLTAGLDLGIGSAVRNRISTLRATGDEDGARDAFGAALIVVTLVSAALAGLLLVAAAAAQASGWTEWPGEQHRAVAAAVVLLGAFQVGNLGQLALYAREQPLLVAGLEVARWLITVPALLLVAFADGGLLAMTATYFVALALSVAAAFPILLTDRRWRRPPPGPARAWRIARRDVWAGAGFAALQIVATLVYQTDVLIAAQLTSLATTGDFALVQRLYLVPLSLLFAAVTPLWARTASEVARGNHRWARTLAERAAGAATGVLALCGGAAVVLGPWAVKVWTGRDVHDRWLYAGFAAWLVVAGWVAVLSVILNGMSRIWPQVRWLTVAVAMKLLVATLAVERVGVAALAWGAAISLLPLALSNWREVRRSLGASGRGTAVEGAA